jgi:hypothetical protein
VADGRGDEDEVITLPETSYLYAEKSRQRPYYLATAIYSFAVNPAGYEWDNRRVIALTAPSPAGMQALTLR